MNNIRTLIICFLCICFQAHAQTRPAAVAPLPPRVVTLDSGQVLRRGLIGIEPATYQRLRAEQANDRQVHRLDSLSLATASKEIARLQKEVVYTYDLLRQEREKLQKAQATHQPFLPAYSAGFGSGFLAGLFIGFKFLPH